MKNDGDYRTELYNALMQDALTRLIYIIYHEVIMNKCNEDVEAYMEVTTKVVNSILESGQQIIKKVMDKVNLNSISEYERIQIMESNADALVKVEKVLDWYFLEKNKTNNKKGVTNEEA